MKIRYNGESTALISEKKTIPDYIIDDTVTIHYSKKVISHGFTLLTFMVHKEGI
jgi:hypothetical protein